MLMRSHLMSKKVKHVYMHCGLERHNVFGGGMQSGIFEWGNDGAIAHLHE